MKLKITMNDKKVFEIEQDIPDAAFMRGLESSKKANTFFAIGDSYINPAQISYVEVLERQNIAQPTLPQEDTRSLEERQLEKQPSLANYRGVFKS